MWIVSIGFSLYTHFVNIYVSSVIALQDIHQGAALSMSVYEIGGNKLLVELNACIYGAKVHNIVIRVVTTTFADDVNLITISREVEQQCVNIAHLYSKM